MGQLRTAPYDVAEGREYAAYLSNMCAECVRLAEAGRLPDTDELAGFLATARQVHSQVAADVQRAEAAGETSVISSIQMSAVEHARMRNMNDSFRNLLEILEMRQAVALNRTPAVARVADAIQAGTYAD